MPFEVRLRDTCGEHRGPCSPQAEQRERRGHRGDTPRHVCRLRRKPPVDQRLLLHASRVIVDKSANKIPLNRQVDCFRWKAISLATLCDLVMRSGGAQAATTLLSLVGNCRLHGVDPWECLHTLLGVITDQSVTKVGELAPIHAARAPVVEG